MRKILSVFAGAAMLLSFSSSAFASTASVTQNVNFRPIPSTNSYVYSLLKVGTSLEVLEHVNAYWLKVSLNGKVGYVSTHFVKETKIPAPTLSADVSRPTNHNVIVTITYPNNASMKQFRINGGNWTSYTAPITITANGLVEARGADRAGNISSIGSYTVSNIDKTPPSVPTLTADKTSVTNQNVSVSISYPADSVVNEYRINGGNWTAYSVPVVIKANGAVEARSTDAAGNVSTIGSYTISNIYKRTIGEKIVDTAKSFQGKVTYKFGVRDVPDLILDCSSFTQYVFKLNGIHIPWSSKEQGNMGEYVSKDNLQPGDLVFFSVSNPTQINHVGIYIGNDQFINNLPNKGVVISNLSSVHWTTHYLTARRIVN